jgi:formylglycine-generating enzyme required for sulfatase activity
VAQVRWADTQQFIQVLNARTGKNYRLPSEAEWEYACRAGKQQEYCGSDDVNSVAWHDGNSSNTTHPAAGKQANAFGLYDMSGNVWEWVADSWHDNYTGAPTDGSAWQGSSTKRVLRGGSWIGATRTARATGRDWNEFTGRSGSGGFRLARSLP